MKLKVFFQESRSRPNVELLVKFVCISAYRKLTPKCYHYTCQPCYTSTVAHKVSLGPEKSYFENVFPQRICFKPTGLLWPLCVLIGQWSATRKTSALRD